MEVLGMKVGLLTPTFVRSFLLAMKFLDVTLDNMNYFLLKEILRHAVHGICYLCNDIGSASTLFL